MIIITQAEATNILNAICYTIVKTTMPYHTGEELTHNEIEMLEKHTRAIFNDFCFDYDIIEINE